MGEIESVREAYGGRYAGLGGVGKVRSAERRGGGCKRNERSAPDKMFGRGFTCVSGLDRS